LTAWFSRYQPQRPRERIAESLVTGNSEGYRLVPDPIVVEPGSDHPAQQIRVTGSAPLAFDSSAEIAVDRGPRAPIANLQRDWQPFRPEERIVEAILQIFPANEERAIDSLTGAISEGDSPNNPSRNSRHFCRKIQNLRILPCRAGILSGLHNAGKEIRHRRPREKRLKRFAEKPNDQ